MAPAAEGGANEAAGDMELRRPQWINEPGLLSVGQLKEIYRRVWPLEAPQGKGSERKINR